MRKTLAVTAQDSAYLAELLLGIRTNNACPTNILHEHRGRQDGVIHVVYAHGALEISRLPRG